MMFGSLSEYLKYLVSKEYPTNESKQENALHWNSYGCFANVEYNSEIISPSRPTTYC